MARTHSWLLEGMRKVRAGLGAIIASVLVAAFAAAQQGHNAQQGYTLFGSFQGGDIDSVNLSNGNLVLQGPLWRVPQRGGKLDLDYFFLYNNKSYFVNCSLSDPD